MEKISKFPWYGNVRELQHSIEKAVILASDDKLKSADFDFTKRSGGSQGIKGSYNIAENEKELIKDALNKYEWNLSRTSLALGINRSTLYDKIKKYGL
jgi:transcriptional regulator of acetoin/glycerol metabolism